MPTKLVTEFEQALVHLALLMAKDQGKLEEARRLRDQMATLERQMTEAEAEFVQALSSDLYMIEDDEIYDGVISGLDEPAMLAQRLHNIYDSQNWEELLTLLRQEAPFVPQEIRAYLRGRAYEELGHYAAAWAFYQDAARRDPDSDKLAYQYFALYNLEKFNSRLAFEQANEYLSESTSHPALRILAANVLLGYFREEVARSNPDTVEERVPGIKNLARQLLPALADVNADSRVPQEVLASGYGALAFILESLGDFENAADMLRILDRYMPNVPQIRLRISKIDGRVHSGHNRNSGILLNPGTKGNPSTKLNRENDFQTATNRKVERAFTLV